MIAPDFFCWWRLFPLRAWPEVVRCCERRFFSAVYAKPTTVAVSREASNLLPLKHPRVFSFFFLPRKQRPTYQCLHQQIENEKVNMSFICIKMSHIIAWILALIYAWPDLVYRHRIYSNTWVNHHLGNSTVDQNDPLRSMFRHEKPPRLKGLFFTTGNTVKLQHDESVSHTQRGTRGDKRS